MKKVLLIAPPFYRLLGSHFNGLHLGIAYIASVLKEHEHEVKVYNADYLETDEYLNQNKLFNNFPSYKEILNNPGHFIWDEIREQIYSFSPDFVGITMLTANYKAAKIIATIVKDLNRDTKIVVGGAHPTLDPKGTLMEEEFDYIIRGEGEFTFLELVDGQREDKIKGLSFKKNNQFIHNESREFIKNLDSLPFPSRDGFLNATKYLHIGYISTGRGCPFSCVYCASPQLWQKSVRFRSVSNVLEEIECLKRDYNFTTIHFVDDTFTLNKRRAKEICQQIIDRKLKISWVCDTRVDCLDEELLSLMKRSGCVRIRIGVETGSNRMLKIIKKGINREIIRKAVNYVKKQELPLTVYLMAGFPGETNEDLRQTIELAKELDADYYSLSILAPYLGSEIWNELEKSGNKPDKEHWSYFYHQSQEVLLNDGLDPILISQFWNLNKTTVDEKKRF